MEEVVISKRLNDKIRGYYLGNVSLFDIGMAYIDECLYSAAASYFLAAARKSKYDIEKSKSIAYCAYAYSMQLEDDSSDWQFEVVEELCKHALVKDRDNLLAIKILANTYKAKGSKNHLYWIEYALKHCDIQDPIDRVLMYKECLEACNTYNKRENREFFEKLFIFIEENKLRIPDEMCYFFYSEMLKTWNDKIVSDKCLEMLERCMSSEVGEIIMHVENKTYCEITSKNCPFTMSKILEGHGFYGSTISPYSIENWGLERANENMPLDKWTITYDDYFTNFKDDSGNAGILIIGDIDQLDSIVKSMSFGDCGFSIIVLSPMAYSIAQQSGIERWYSIYSEFSEHSIIPGYKTLIKKSLA